MRHARFRPLLLVGSALTVLPALAGGPTATWIVAVVAIIAGLAVLLWAVDRVEPFDPVTRDQLALVISLVAAAGWLTALSTDGRHRPEAYLLLGSSLICAMSSAPARWLRLSIQAVTVTSMAAVLAVAGRTVLDVVFLVLLLGAVALLADLYASELVSSRRVEVSSRADMERRAELLAAVRDLASGGPAEAMAATVRALRGLGHDAAAVGLVRDGMLEPAVVDGIPQGSMPLARGEGLAWLAIGRDETVVTSDYSQEEGALPGRQGVRAAVIAPIHVDGEPAGVVIGARWAAVMPDAADVEVVEVLAAHLGGVLDTHGRVRRQRELLDRMAELDRMRTGFVMAVSGELRDPLTVIRGVGQTLVARPGDIDTIQRHGLLERMCAQAADLRRTIDALLDFSRFQAEREEAELVVVGTGALLRPVVAATGVDVTPDLDVLTGGDYVVEVDASAVRHALGLLIVAGGQPAGAARPVLRVGKRDGAVVVEVERATPPSGLVRSLAGQLLVVGGARLEDGAAPVVCLPTADTTSRTLTA